MDTIPNEHSNLRLRFMYTISEVLSPTLMNLIELIPKVFGGTPEMTLSIQISY